MNLGAPAEKLVLGLPTYGRSFTLQDATKHEPPMVATGGGQQGSITREGGYLGYQEICLNIKENGWKMVEDSKGPYAYKGNQWVGYDTISSVRVKADYILNKNLGGAMFWDLATDDFNVSFLHQFKEFYTKYILQNRCGDGKFPLIQEVNNILNHC